MPEGPLGFPRLFYTGPLSRATEEELKENWDECPNSGKEREICREIKRISIELLDGEGFVAQCKTLSDINGGSCYVVTDYVLPRVDGVEVWQIGDGDHFWIEYNGKAYDAEVPTGVESWRELPIIKDLGTDVILKFSKQAAEAEGDPVPETIEDTVKNVTEDRQKYGQA